MLPRSTLHYLSALTSCKRIQHQPYIHTLQTAHQSTASSYVQPTDIHDITSTTDYTNPHTRSLYNPSTGLKYTQYTLKRRQQQKPWSISSNELQSIYKPFNTSTTILKKAIPLNERIHKPKHVMQCLRTEERNRIVHEFPRYIEPFGPGDKILLTVYISLYKNKFERTTGIVLAVHGGNSITSKFTMRAYVDEIPYELSYPIHSPWIREITVLQKSERHPRKKMWYLRNYEREELQTFFPKEYGVSDEEAEAKRIGRAKQAAKQAATKKK